MKLIDAILALVAGRIIGFLLTDFLKESNFHFGFYYQVFVWLVLPLFSLFCLWIAYLIGKKFLFVYQSAKFILVGGVATIIDLKLFEFLVWIFASFILVNSLVFKGISFIVATLMKYWGNKYWTFQQYERKDMYKEMIKLFIMDGIALAINVAAFYYFTKILGVPSHISAALWTKASVIFAALTSAIFTFLGYKFFVFKK